ncbi:MAG: sulfatase-like hydrolase/transferase [Rhodospirillales bacterium]|nr:sulfatase-like hydrolase/transferase [Rhodospirillales bacterium]
MPTSVRNVLFIMCDQLRWDHLRCYGHPTIRTHNIDALAARGVRFASAFVASGICGPSRMSFYTGRYMSSHGATSNRVPLSVGEMTLGEYLEEAGVMPVLAGKSHVIPDRKGLARLAIDGASKVGLLLAAGGFREIDRYDGHHAPGAESGYPAFLRSHGYVAKEPWGEWVISVLDAEGNVRSGWQMRHAHLPARVREEESETAYMTDRAMRFIESEGGRPWMLHLSYVKPHWPYIAPAPYHGLYAQQECLPLRRTERERAEAHPVYAAYLQREVSVNFAREEVAWPIRRVYQGLVQQIDDHLGRLFDLMERLGRWEDTLVIFTSDHGDYLGDHWLGEKELFHDTIQRVPLIIAHPEGVRGVVAEELVSTIDVLPTILEGLGISLPSHRIEGHSLLPRLLAGADSAPRRAVFSELDYSFSRARLTLKRGPADCRGWMVRTARWKYVHWIGFPPQLFDLADDPEEFSDLGTSNSHEQVRAEMRALLLDWHGGLKRRVTMTDDEVAAATDRHKEAGVFFGVW